MTIRSRFRRSPRIPSLPVLLLLALVGGAVPAIPVGAGMRGQEAAAGEERCDPARGPGTECPGTDRPMVEGKWRIRPLGGDPVPLERFRGRVVFLNAWASWCTPCIREMASIEALALRAAERGLDVAFLLVAVEGERAVRDHLRRYPSTLPIHLEEDRFPRALGIRGIPTTWILDGEGRVAFRRFGAARWDAPEVLELLEALEGERGALAPASVRGAPETRRTRREG